MVSKLPIFPIEDYLIKEPLGSGAFGTVLLYEKKQSHSKLSTGTPKKVALKMFYLKDVNNFDTELEHMKTIGTTTPNVVMFFGACTLDKGRVGLVMEHFDMDLWHYIDLPPCTLCDAKLILQQVATGLK